MIAHPTGATNATPPHGPDVDEWLDSYVDAFNRFADPRTVRCFLGHHGGLCPRLVLLLQDEDGEGFAETLVIRGARDLTSGRPQVRDSVEGLQMFALLLARIGQSAILEFGAAMGRKWRHPVFEMPYHAFDDSALPWEGTKRAPKPGKRMAGWVQRHAEAVTALGPVSLLHCQLSAHWRGGVETVRCDFSAPCGGRHAIVLNVTGSMRLAFENAEVDTTSYALCLLAHLLRAVRITVTLQA